MPGRAREVPVCALAGTGHCWAVQPAHRISNCFSKNFQGDSIPSWLEVGVCHERLRVPRKTPRVPHVTPHGVARRSLLSDVALLRAPTAHAARALGPQMPPLQEREVGRSGGGCPECLSQGTRPGAWWPALRPTRSAQDGDGRRLAGHPLCSTPGGFCAGPGLSRRPRWLHSQRWVGAPGPP